MTMAKLLCSNWPHQDFRSSSTSSLVPPTRSSTDTRRKLLLIYVHGFLGNETSFQHFPAHVHHRLADTLRDTHVVHTKIYPKYKTRYKIDQVKNIFSEWLAPHESPDQDVVLLGHSMGGILTAEVVLQLLYPSGGAGGPRFRHRILGTVNFDVPFLGMHPGVVGSGLGSIVKPAQKPSGTQSPIRPADISGDQIGSQQNVGQTQAAAQSDMSLTTQSSRGDDSTGISPWSSSLGLPDNDPNFNPSYTNDVVLPKRTGWSNIAHFFQKHSNDLLNAAETLVTSHLEFGGAMADFRTLNRRYERIRALEKQTEGRRVRFVNYYTACTGRPKKDKAKEATEVEAAESASLAEPADALSTSMSNATLETTTPSPRISIDTLATDKTRALGRPEAGGGEEVGQVSEDVSPPAAFGTEEAVQAQKSVQAPHPATIGEDRAFLASSGIQADPQVEEDIARAMALDPDERREQLASEHLQDEPRREEIDAGKPDELSTDVDDALLSASQNTTNRSSSSETKAEAKARRKAEKINAKQSKPPKDKKFCLLPSKMNGKRDPCWVRVFMPNVDEVGAHCGLFTMEDDPQRYQIFVLDVSSGIHDWVRDSQ